MLINHVVSSTGLCLSPAVSGVWGPRYCSHSHINKDDTGLLLPEIPRFFSPPPLPLPSPALTGMWRPEIAQIPPPPQPPAPTAPYQSAVCTDFCLTNTVYSILLFSSEIFTHCLTCMPIGIMGIVLQSNFAI